HWHSEAARMHQVICERSWNPEMGSFVAAMEGKTLDASLLRLGELGFLAEDDPRFAGTVRAIERELRSGDFIFRYVEADDFGKPEDRKSTRLNSSHVAISYAVFCLKKKKTMSFSSVITDSISFV